MMSNETSCDTKEMRSNYQLTSQDGSLKKMNVGEQGSISSSSVHGERARVENHARHKPNNYRPSNYKMRWKTLPSCQPRHLSLQHHCEKLVRFSRYQWINIGLIILNALMMGIGTFDFITEYPNRSQTFQILDVVFLFFFTLDLIIEYLAWGSYMLRDGWLLMDFTVVALNWLLLPLQHRVYDSVQVLKAFRILRLLRFMLQKGSLKRVIVTFLNIIPQMGSCLTLLSIIFYIFSVMFTALFKDLYKQGLTSEDYFSRLDITFFTLFQIMTMDGWANISREVMETYWWSWALFLMFVLTSAFVLVNVVIAVIFSTTHESASKKARRMDGILSSASKELCTYPNDSIGSTCSFTSQSNACHCSENIQELQAQIDALTCQTSQLIVLLLDQKQSTSDKQLETSDKPVESSDKQPETSDKPVESSDKNLETSDKQLETSDKHLETSDDKVDEGGRSSVDNKL